MVRDLSADTSSLETSEDKKLSEVPRRRIGIHFC
jgi:hypothetical protein